MNKAFDKILEFIDEQIKIEESIAKSKNEGHPITHQYGANCMNVVKKFVQEVAEEYKGGWIPCSERLPEDDKKQYIVQKTNGFIDILGFTKDAYKLDRYDFAEYKGKNKQLFYEYDSEYGYIEWECEAWQPLPEPFKERD